MPHLPRVGAFPIAAERSILTAAGAALKIPAKEKDSPLIGEYAPEIIAKDHLGRTVSLHSTIALGRPIVLYFFPLAGSPHCTKESCSFRDAVGTSPIFNDLNAVVIGISQDPPARSRRFVDEHHLGFRILHDENRRIMDTYGVGRGLLGLIDGRCTFIIDHEGLVRAMLDGVWDYQGHRDFAEKWLCRIEHELSGRERFFVEHDADDSVAVDEATRNVKVIYGSDVASRGIASAPRHGAAPTASKKGQRPTKYSSSSTLVAELEPTQTLTRSKSRKNIKHWFRSNTANGADGYDEPLQVDYKYTNRSLDDVAHNKAQRALAGNAGKSSDKQGGRVQSLRLGKSGRDGEADPPLPANAAALAREYDERSPRSRQGSGSGWATPSTISAGSHSTGETSVASPRAETRDTLATTTPTTVGHFGMSQDVTLERSASARLRASNASSGVAASGIIPKQRSSSLRKIASVDKATNKREVTESPSRVARASHGSQAPEDVPQDVGEHTDPAAGMPVYANGNIAKMQLLPRELGERSMDSAARSSYSRNSASDSPRTINASLPIPPRPASRSSAGTAKQQQTLDEASTRSGSNLRPSTPTQARVNGSHSDDEEETSNDSSVVKARRVRVNSVGNSAVAVGIGSPIRKKFNGSRLSNSQTTGSSASDGVSSPPSTPKYSTPPASSSSRAMSPAASSNGTWVSDLGGASGPDAAAVTQGLKSLVLVDAQRNGNGNEVNGNGSAHANSPRYRRPSSSFSRRNLPKQSPVPKYAPPSAPIGGDGMTKSPSGLSTSSSSSDVGSTSFGPNGAMHSRTGSAGNINGDGKGGNSGVGLGLGISSASAPSASAAATPSAERRYSLTPSMTPSTVSATDSAVAASENEYSPSLAESHHTFGGSLRGRRRREGSNSLTATDDDDDDDDHDDGDYR